MSSKTGLIFYLADFHGRNWRITGYESKTQHRALFSTKTNQAVNIVTQAVVKVGLLRSGLKVGLRKNERGDRLKPDMSVSCDNDTALPVVGSTDHVI